MRFHCIAMPTPTADRFRQSGVDSEGRLLYDLNDTVTGDRLAPLVGRCLDDPRTQYVNIHTGRPGCFLCRAERI